MPDSVFYSKSKNYSLKELAAIAECEISENSNADLVIEDLATLNNAEANHISFLSNKKYIAAFKSTKAGAVIIANYAKSMAPEGVNLLIAKDPYLAYAKIATAFYPQITPKKYQAPTAFIENTAKIDDNCYIGHASFIGKNVKIGKSVTISPGAYIGDGCEIGDNTYIGPNVNLISTKMGANCIIHSGVCIGQDGFGFAQSQQGHFKVPQLGRVIIGNFVEIGANSCIDCGAIEDTHIGDFCKLDNMVQLGHNVKLGMGCVIVSLVGIAGSTELGDFVVVGGQVGIAGHVKIGSMTQIAAQSGVHKDLEGGRAYGGAPVEPIREWQRKMMFMNNHIKKLMQERKETA